MAKPKEGKKVIEYDSVEEQTVNVCTCCREEDPTCFLCEAGEMNGEALHCVDKGQGHICDSHSQALYNQGLTLAPLKATRGK